MYLLLLLHSPEHFEIPLAVVSRCFVGGGEEARSFWFISWLGYERNALLKIHSKREHIRDY